MTEKYVPGAVSRTVTVAAAGIRHTRERLPGKFVFQFQYHAPRNLFADTRRGHQHAFVLRHDSHGQRVGRDSGENAQRGPRPHSRYADKHTERVQLGLGGEAVEVENAVAGLQKRVDLPALTAFQRRKRVAGGTARVADAAAVNHRHTGQQLRDDAVKIVKHQYILLT